MCGGLGVTCSVGLDWYLWVRTKKFYLSTLTNPHNVHIYQWHTDWAYQPWVGSKILWRRVRICERRRRDKLGGSGGMFPLKMLKSGTSEADAISWGFRVNLRQKREVLSNPPPPPRSATATTYKPVQSVHNYWPTILAIRPDICVHQSITDNKHD